MEEEYGWSDTVVKSDPTLIAVRGKLDYVTLTNLKRFSFLISVSLQFEGTRQPFLHNITAVRVVAQMVCEPLIEEFINTANLNANQTQTQVGSFELVLFMNLCENEYRSETGEIHEITPFCWTEKLMIFIVQERNSLALK